MKENTHNEKAGAGGESSNTTTPSIDELREEAKLLDQGITNLDVQIGKLTAVRTDEKKKLRAIMGRIETLAMKELRAAA